MVNLGVSGLLFRGWNLEQFVRYVAVTHGLHHVDLWPHNYEGRDARTLASVLDDHGVRVSSLHVPRSYTDTGVVSPALSRETVADTFELASALGCSDVQVYPTPRASTRAGGIRAVSEWLRPLVARARNLGLHVVIENNFDHGDVDPWGADPCRGVAGLSSLFDELGDDALKFCYDPANFLLAGESSRPDGVEELFPRLVNLHIKDARQPEEWPDDRLGDLEAEVRDAWRDERTVATVPGCGAVPWSALLRDVGAAPRAPWLTLDPLCAPYVVDRWLAAAVPALERMVQDWKGRA